MKLDFNKHIFCIITGASCGIGQKIAEEFARRASFVTFLLIAGSETGLNETKSLIKEINKNAVIFCKPLDLSQPDVNKFRLILKNSFDPILYETAIIFHNAGQIGQIEKSVKLGSAELWRSYYNSNFFSLALLNTLCLQMMKNLAELFVVNITSYAARQPIKYLSMYGSCKAARDIYFKVLALEEPEIMVLNYSPSIVETLVTEELMVVMKNYQDNDTHSFNDNLINLTPGQTTLKLLSLLEMGGFNSGDTIDYYDSHIINN